ncbi:MAG: UvrB/UvrC motif-containing protein [Candidatus Omnitrophica bacterium]|nr:UvrB/UvrC motif-containing protein [Candidatus Omnitrophota bacterium]
MLCGSCQQNEATIHLTEIVNNQMVEVHLCETCAEEKGTEFKNHFNFGDLLSGLSDIGSLFGPEQKTDISCKTCHLTFEEFGKTGRLGCANCYQTLSKMLLPLVKRVQRATTHMGKRPSKVSAHVKQSVDLRSLQERLRKSIELEEFESAAKLRDEIRKLEEKQEKRKKEPKE